MYITIRKSYLNIKQLHFKTKQIIINGCEFSNVKVSGYTPGTCENLSFLPLDIKEPSLSMKTN